MKAKLQAAAAEHGPDVLMWVGAAAVSYGVGLMHMPAGVITGGLFMLAAGFIGARR